MEKNQGGKKGFLNRVLGGSKMGKTEATEIFRDNASVSSLGSLRSQLSKTSLRNHPFRQSLKNGSSRRSLRGLKQNENRGLVKREQSTATVSAHTDPSFEDKLEEVFGATLEPRRKELQHQLQEKQSLNFIGLEYQRALCDKDNGYFNYVANGCLSDDHRTTLVKWLLELGEDFEFNPETKFLMIEIMDRYLSKTYRTGGKIPLKYLQLIACGAMLLATKVNERYPASVEDLVSSCDGLYKKEQFFDMERKMFQTLNWNLNFPVAYSFTRYLSNHAFRQEPGHFLRKLTLVRFICEVSLLDSSFIGVSQSQIVAAAFLVIFKLRKRGLLKTNEEVCNQWTSQMEYLTSYDEQSIRHIADQIHRTLVSLAKESLLPTQHSQDYAQKKFSGLVEKYGEENFFQISSICIKFYIESFKL